MFIIVVEIMVSFTCDYHRLWSIVYGCFTPHSTALMSTNSKMYILFEKNHPSNRNRGLKYQKFLFYRHHELPLKVSQNKKYKLTSVSISSFKW